MLVLTRRASERIMIGKDIVITVCEVHGNKVRIGIEAPDSVAVMREEVLGRAVRNTPEAPNPLETNKHPA